MTRWAARATIAGAAIQIGYSVLAWVYGHPTITGRFFEAVWACANARLPVGHLPNKIDKPARADHLTRVQCQDAQRRPATQSRKWARDRAHRDIDRAEKSDS